MTFNNRTVFLTLIATLGFAIVVALNSVVKRVELESTDKTIEVVMSQKDLSFLAASGGATEKEVINRFQKTGAFTSILLAEDTLTDFEEAGLATILKGSEIINLYRIGHINRYVLNYIYKQVDVKPDHFYIIVEKRVDFERIRDFLTAELGKKNVNTIGNNNIVEVLDNKTDLYQIGLGFSADQIESYQNDNLSVILSLKSSNRNTKIAIRQKFQQISEQFYDISKIHLDGDVVLGHPNMVEEVYTRVSAGNYFLIKTEFGKTAGFNALSKKLPEKVIQMHKLPDNLLSRMQPNDVLRRFIRAVNERRIHMLQVRPILTTSVLSQDVLEYHERFLSQLNNNIKRQHKRVNTLSGLNIHKKIPLTTLEKIGVSIGIVAVLMLLINQFNALSPLGYGLIMFIYFALIYISVRFSLWSITEKIMAFIAVVIFPSYAIIANFPKENPSTETPIKRLFRSISAVLKIWIVTLLGGILVTALLSDMTYLFKIDQFRGVKAAFIFALVLIGIYFFLRPHRVSAMLYVFKRIFFVPIRTISFVAVIITLTFVVLYLIRSGNNGMLAVFPFEKSIRYWLEESFLIRPRTKEFLLGYPVLLAAAYYIDHRIARDWLWFYIIVASIGLTSMINTFCHLHTPFLISLYRSVLGLVLGFMIFILYWGLITLIRKGLRKLY